MMVILAIIGMEGKRTSSGQDSKSVGLTSGQSTTGVFVCIYPCVEEIEEE